MNYTMQTHLYNKVKVSQPPFRGGHLSAARPRRGATAAFAKGHAGLAAAAGGPELPCARLHYGGEMAEMFERTIFNKSTISFSLIFPRLQKYESVESVKRGPSRPCPRLRILGELCAPFGPGRELSP